MKLAYYNEHDNKAAAWLRELMTAGVIAPGDVDERSIVEVQPDDIKGYTQCNFFAGIGVWSYALRRAGWADDRPVWTGSCPCQPFSAAGQGKGFDDERHLWPAWFRLISQCRPPSIFGEQVAGAAGLSWFDLVSTDLEGEGYACGAADIPAAGVGAPHIRQRLYWVAHAEHAQRRAECEGDGTAHGGYGPGRRSDANCMADAADPRHDDPREYRGRGPHQGTRPQQCGPADLLGDAESRGRGIGGDAARPRRGGYADGAGKPGGLAHTEYAERRPCAAGGNDGDGAQAGRDQSTGLPGERGEISGLADADGGDASAERQQRGGEHGQQPANGGAADPWSDCIWFPCRDGRARPIPRATEPGAVALADGASGGLGLVRLARRAHGEVEGEEVVVYAPLVARGKARTMRLRGYGNAIVAPLAAEFVAAAMEAME